MIVDIEAREEEQLQSQPLEQMEEVGRHGVVTQEPTPLEIFVGVATQMVGELEVEMIPDMNLEVFTVTPEQYQDTELEEGELQQWKIVEVDQDIVTQEPTSSENLAETPIRLGETDLEVEIILDVELGEDEQMLSQPLGDTEAFGDQSHLFGDTEEFGDQYHLCGTLK